MMGRWPRFTTTYLTLEEGGIPRRREVASFAAMVREEAMAHIEENATPPEEGEPNNDYLDRVVRTTLQGLAENLREVLHDAGWEGMACDAAQQALELLLTCDEAAPMLAETA